MRLIDADALKEAFYNRHRTPDDAKYLRVPAEVVYQFIDNAPTVDVISNEEGYEMYGKGYLQGYERGKREKGDAE